jgi:FdhE protein
MGDIDPVALVEAAVCQDDAQIDALAEDAGVDGAAFRVLAQMAALPLLQTCGRALREQIHSSWWEGYCPVCGAWPTLAEFRGLERKRWLRCGRCATGWEVQWLRCPFCDETDHTNLGYLAPEEGETSRKVEVCDNCKGYVKAEPTVRNLAPWEILLDDLATVPLEVAALDRGYHRPERPGFALEVRILEK